MPSIMLFENNFANMFTFTAEMQTKDKIYVSEQRSRIYRANKISGFTILLSSIFNKKRKL